MARTIGTSDAQAFSVHDTAFDNALDFTIAYWIKPVNAGPSFAMHLGQVDKTTGANGFEIFSWFADQSRFALRAADGNSNDYVLDNGTGSLTFGVWQSLLATFHSTPGVNSVLTGWINGGLVLSGAFGAGHTAGTCTDPFQIGNAIGAFPLDIAEVAVWNRELTADQRAMFDAGYSPLLIPGGLPRIYVPNVRDANDRMGNIGTPTLTGTSVVEHPRVLYSKRRSTFFVPSAGAADTLFAQAVM